MWHSPGLFCNPVTACNTFGGIHEYIIFFAYLDNLRIVVRNTSNTMSLNTISLFCSLGAVPNCLSLEIIPPWPFANREGGVRDMVPGDDEHFFLFVFFSFELWGGPRESVSPGSSDRQPLQLQDHQIDIPYSSQGRSSRTEPIQYYSCVGELYCWVVLFLRFISEEFFASQHVCVTTLRMTSWPPYWQRQAIMHSRNMSALKSIVWHLLFWTSCFQVFIVRSLCILWTACHHSAGYLCSSAAPASNISPRSRPGCLEHI